MMTNIFLKKGIIYLVSSLSVLSLFATSCGSASNEYTQELKNQVSALETQNALLLDNQNAVSSNAADNGVNAPQPPSNNTNAQLITATPYVESLPLSPVQAGIPIMFDGFALTLSNEIETGKWNGEEYFTLSFTLRNISGQTRVFRYIKSGVAVSDNLGNRYSFSLSDTDCVESPDNIHLTQQLTLKSGESMNINSSDWLGCWQNNYIPPIKGVLPITVNQLIVTINNWGPFNGVTFILDL